MLEPACDGLLITVGLWDTHSTFTEKEAGHRRVGTVMIPKMLLPSCLSIPLLPSLGRWFAEASPLSGEAGYV